MKEHIQKSLVFDQLAYPDKLIEEALDGEARNHPGNGFEIVDDGPDIVIADRIALFLLLADLPATCFKFASGVGQIPGRPLISAWMNMMLLRWGIPQQLVQPVIRLVTDLLRDKVFAWLEHALDFAGLVTAVAIDDEIERGIR